MIRITVRPHLAGALLLSLACSVAVARAQPPHAATTGAVMPDSTVVAIVLGAPVTYGQIHIGSFANRSPFAAPKGASAAFGANPSFMNPDMQTRFAGLRLGTLISERLRANLVARQHLQPTPAMIAASQKKLENEMFEGQPMDKYLAQKRARILTLKKALDEVSQGKNPDLVYKTEVASQLSPAFWQMEVQAYKNPMGRRGLQMVLDSMNTTRYRASIAAMAPEQAQNAAIDQFVDQKLAASDPSFKRFLAETAPDAKAAAYLGQKRSAWWRAQIEHNVVFKVESFRAPAEQISSGMGNEANSAFERGYMMGYNMARTHGMGTAGSRPGL